MLKNVFQILFQIILPAYLKSHTFQIFYFFSILFLLRFMNGMQDDNNKLLNPSNIQPWAEKYQK